ncbi:MAG: phage portal protein [Desulfurellales bacterium]|nr:MAG: phage portal protein [Desulfurellales bacterium]
MFRWLTRRLRGATAKAGEVLSMRRWDAAKNDRHNEAHWKDAQGATVNQDLLLDRDKLVARAMEEVQNNPFVEGVVQTHVSSVVGAEGPILQVSSGSKNYNETFEAIWWDWWQSPEMSGTLSGVDLLQQCVRLLWSNGEFLCHEVDDPNADGISYRLALIHPRRLVDPNLRFNDRIMMGVERDTDGRPVTYYIRDFDTDDVFLKSLIVDPKPYPAERIIHGYKPLEPGQVRGVPWVAPSLQTVADLRDYDRSVLRTARIQANLSVLLTTNHPDAPFVNVNEQTDMPEAAIVTAPPGWQPTTMQSTQPGPLYRDYRAEKLRELGRPVNMPLMMVMLDSGDHNYSSARFDGQLYNRGVQCLQSWLNRVLLDRIAARVERQAILSGRLRRRPADAYFNWTWPVAPHVDPQKEAKAWETMISIGAASEFDAAASQGKDFETVVAARKRAKELLEEAGLPPTGGSAQPAQPEPEQPEPAPRRRNERLVG